MKWSLLSAHASWFLAVSILLAILDIFLIARHFKERREDALELVSRIAGSNFFGFYLAYRVFAKWEDVERFPRHQTPYAWAQWVLIILPFVIFFWSYLFRKPPLRAADRFREILFPLFCAILPFAVYESGSWIHQAWFYKTPLLREFFKPFYPAGFGVHDALAFCLIFAGDALALWGLLHLKRSFSIMSEVRDWVRGGPYRWVRHPMYSGEILATLGFCLLKFSYFNLFLTLLFVLLLALRARFEEEKILPVYPEYADYRKKTGFLFPNWRSS